MFVSLPLLYGVDKGRGIFRCSTWQHTEVSDLTIVLVVTHIVMLFGYIPEEDEETFFDVDQVAVKLLKNRPILG